MKESPINILGKIYFWGHVIMTTLMLLNMQGTSSMPIQIYGATPFVLPGIGFVYCILIPFYSSEWVKNNILFYLFITFIQLPPFALWIFFYFLN